MCFHPHHTRNAKNTKTTKKKGVIFTYRASTALRAQTEYNPTHIKVLKSYVSL